MNVSYMKSFRGYDLTILEEQAVVAGLAKPESGFANRLLVCTESSLLELKKSWGKTRIERAHNRAFFTDVSLKRSFGVWKLEISTYSGELKYTGERDQLERIAEFLQQWEHQTDYRAETSNNSTEQTASEPDWSTARSVYRPPAKDSPTSALTDEVKQAGLGCLLLVAGVAIVIFVVALSCNGEETKTVVERVVDTVEVETVVVAYPTVTPTAVGGSIAFQSARDGNFEIYVMNADGSGVVRLTDNDFGDEQPAWSPDGQRIAFRSVRDGNPEIYVMNADGSGVVRLTDNDFGDWEPAWSPDGRRIAFRSDRDGDFEIYVMNIDGSGVVRLTDNDSYDTSPAWSPDGRLIAFHSDRDGDFEIYVMNADGNGVVRLTDNDSWDDSPAWSPDGRRIAFTSNRDDPDPKDDEHVMNIYVMNADGNGVVRLTGNVSLNDEPAWSPDGRRIAFHSDRDEDGEIYAINVDGSGVMRLTDNDFGDWEPAWSPVFLATATPTATQISTPLPSPTPGPTETPTPTATPAPPSTPTELVIRVQHSIVQVEARSGGTIFGLTNAGSGFIFAVEGTTAFIATNHHIIDGSNSVEVQTGDLSTYDALVLGWDAERDVAVLSICCSSNFIALPWGDASPSEGETVIAIGYPDSDAGNLVATIGEVRAPDDLSMEHEFISHSAPLNPGNSGGPLLSMPGSEVIGINVARGTEALAFYAVPYQAIEEQVEEWRSQLIVVPSPIPKPDSSTSESDER